MRARTHDVASLDESSPHARALVKRSLTLSGHRTSVSLEKEFWEALHEIADEKNLSTAALVSLIDRARQPEQNLSSAIRVYVLNSYRPVRDSTTA